MGCVGSKGDVDQHPNVFRVVQGHEGPGGQAAGQELTSGQLEVTSTNLTLYRKRKPPTQWPLQCLRRYGYENDTFIFEAGRRCKTGEGIYSFRCRRADVLFNLLQDYIQESTYNNNNNMTVNSLDEVQQSQERMDQDVAELRRALINQQQQQQTTSGSNYIILHGNSNATATNSGSGGPTQIPCSTTSPGRPATMNTQCHSSPQNAAAAANNNYLDPLEATSTSAATPATIVANHSSNNNNIYTNSMMIPGAGNVYQQLALAQSSPLAGAALKQATVESSPAGTPGSASGRPLLANSESLMRLRQSMSTEEVIVGRQSLATSPVPLDDAQQQPLNTYMNVTPGEMMLLGQSSTGVSTPGANTGSLSWRYSRMNSNASTTTTITERCYENMDAAVLSEVLNGPPLFNSTSSNAISSGPAIVMGNGGSGGRAFGGRHSRPDIFSKVDLPMIDGAGFRMSEPCTPTSAGGVAMNAAQQRKVNYIVLDLDGTSSSAAATGGTTTTATTTSASTVNGSGSVGSAANGQQQGTSNSLTTPESPKKRQTLGYATIDFNKTVALSNSTNPTCESEASRKTRF